MYYIKKDPKELMGVINGDSIRKAIEKIIGKRSVSMGFTNGQIRELEIDVIGLSASKKKELQNYVDTLEK